MDNLFMEYSSEDMLMSGVEDSFGDQEPIPIDPSQTAEMGHIRDDIASHMWNDYVEHHPRGTGRTNPIDRERKRVGDDARGRDGGVTGGVHGSGGRRAGVLAAPGSHSLAHPHPHPSPRPLRLPAAAHSPAILRPAVPLQTPPADAASSLRVESLFSM
ncbi:hypothetical protein ZIOFF_036017 [Zingiber officinale]|uniref:Uncharacterized protein n=1 Tax=Zingiber officinale TaxID=94328 RepID=A0A8J5KY77_ZINOF|nr:hypothetical protein ZIOFF_036017 [Zingiber officinale]